MAVVVFTSTFLLKDYASGAYAGKLDATDILSIRRSLLFFAVSLLLVFIDLLATYNWFAHGLEHAIKQTGISFRAAGEPFEYRKRMGEYVVMGPY